MRLRPSTRTPRASSGTTKSLREWSTVESLSTTNHTKSRRTCSNLLVRIPPRKLFRLGKFPENLAVSTFPKCSKNSDQVLNTTTPPLQLRIQELGTSRDQACPAYLHSLSPAINECTTTRSRTAGAWADTLQSRSVSSAARAKKSTPTVL